LGLGDDARDQRQVMVDFKTPARDGRLSGFGQFCGERLPRTRQQSCCETTLSLISHRGY
jgi:hypothetical protein